VNVELKDKVIVVTGASAGIGLEIAKSLVREGARVVFAARSLAKLDEEVRRAIVNGGTAMAVRMDVTSDASVATAIGAVLERFGRIDILINNAGNAGPMSLWASADPDATRNLFDVHVLGADRVMRAALPAMRRQGSGTIVNFASTVAWVPMPGAAAYSAAKAAVVSLSETLREELKGEAIDVRIFAPPHTSTESQTLPLDLPNIFTPEQVAAEFVRALRGDRARVVAGGNAMLLLIQRISRSLAARIMNRLGFKALAKVHGDRLGRAPGLADQRQRAPEG
jgi:NADP-dependent 3-hydroxy acid dehydrogenase YdfG